MDYRKPNSQAEPGSFLGLEGGFKRQDNGYPGGPFFDPLGFSRYASREFCHTHLGTCAAICNLSEHFLLACICF